MEKNQTLSSNKKQIIEEKINKQRKEGAIRLRSELKNKLEKLDKKISILSQSPSPPKEVEETHFSDPISLTKRLRKEQIQREKRLREQLLHREQMLHREEIREKEKEQQQIIEKEQEKQKRLDDLEERNRLRQLKLEEMHSQAKHGVNYKPLYVKNAEEFHRNVVIPELEEREEALLNIKAQKQRTNFKQHQKAYEEILRERQERRSFAPSVDDAIWVNKKARMVAEADRMDKFKSFIKAKERYELAKRQQAYGKYISIVHFPNLDPFKKHEVEVTIDKLKNPIKKRAHSNNSPLLVQRFKRQMTERPTLSLAYQHDYLDWRRRVRRNLEQKLLNSNSTPAAKDETVFNGVLRESSFNSKSLKAEDRLNNLLISNVRAKIARLTPN